MSTFRQRFVTASVACCLVLLSFAVARHLRRESTCDSDRGRAALERDLRRVAEAYAIEVPGGVADLSGAAVAVLDAALRQARSSPAPALRLGASLAESHGLVGMLEGLLSLALPWESLAHERRVAQFVVQLEKSGLGGVLDAAVRVGLRSDAGRSWLVLTLLAARDLYPPTRLSGTWRELLRGGLGSDQFVARLGYVHPEVICSWQWRFGEFAEAVGQGKHLVAAQWLALTGVDADVGKVIDAHRALTLGRELGAAESAYCAAIGVLARRGRAELRIVLESVVQHALAGEDHWPSIAVTAIPVSVLRGERAIVQELMESDVGHRTRVRCALLLSGDHVPGVLSVGLHYARRGESIALRGDGVGVLANLLAASEPSLVLEAERCLRTVVEEVHYVGTRLDAAQILLMRAYRPPNIEWAREMAHSEAEPELKRVLAELAEGKSPFQAYYWRTAFPSSRSAPPAGRTPR